MADRHIAHAARGASRPLRFTPPAAARESESPVVRALVGHAPAMQAVLTAMARMAPHARATLVTGETGTGKSTIARALHRLGPQRAAAFQTAAGAEVTGSLDVAGTVFVPDVGDLAHDAQRVLARAIAGAAHAPAGEGLHVVAATEGDLRRAVAEGRFRAELYYRLTAFELHLPPLRDRLDDVPDLAAAFLRAACARLGVPPKQFTAGATRLLQGLPWPGNLRELRNVVERAGVLWEGDVLGEPAIRAALVLGAPGARGAAPPSEPASARLHDAQHLHVSAVLAAAGGNKTAAAARLGVSRRALYRLIDRLERRRPAATADDEL